MPFSEQTLDAFLGLLSSKAPVPGGGAASALAGATAAALTGMVAALTVGKPKYAAVEAEMRAVLEQAEELRLRFLALMDEDAEAFGPLTTVYRMPKDGEAERAARANAMETALRTAVEPPMRILETCGPLLELTAVCAEKGSSLAVSDAGVAASLCRAALDGAKLNVFINTQSMRDRAYASMLEQRAAALTTEYGARADTIANRVAAALGVARS